MKEEYTKEHDMDGFEDEAKKKLMAKNKKEGVYMGREYSAEPGMDDMDTKKKHLAQRKSEGIYMDGEYSTESGTDDIETKKNHLTKTNAEQQMGMRRSTAVPSKNSPRGEHSKRRNEV